ncbi:hypothetical protein PTKIN_Ptkin06aG0031900 [Pterospermum kingtungense]
MLMIEKEGIRIGSVPETDDIVNDREMPDLSSQATLSLVSNPNHHSKHVPVTLTRKFGVQSSSIQSGIRRKCPEIDDSIREVSSYNENLFSRADDDGARMSPRSSESGVDISKGTMPIDRDIEAALILMQLSNDISGLFKTKMQSPSKGACLVQRNQTRRKFGSGSSKSQLDNLYKRYGKFEAEGLSLLKQKKAADGKSMRRQVELDDHCINAQRVIEGNELPVSSVKKRELPKSSLIGSSTNTGPEPKPFKMMQLNSVCPTAHAGFSFSIIHFLSAIRIALITPDAKDDSLAFSKCTAKSDPKSTNRYHERKRIGNSQREQKSSPCLTMPEIVEHLRLNPGDPCVLDAREPLQDLVRGALNIFSSTKAPLGVKAWKALTVYSKSNKSWSWIGPIMPHNHIKEAVSSEAWGLPSKTLVKLVNSFADWLKIVQESLQKIGDLPAPPLTLMHRTISVMERLREVRPRKTVATISRCPEEIRDYFRKEEAVRYIVPDRAFPYTAVDGRKSTVAPLRRRSGKPSSKCREHFMLKADRPPNITVLSLVRDAAARLPASIGTRADICVLIRDSQYIVEDISEEQLNQVVSGALDRLHYEHDPCVQFNGERKLWFYLHGDREEDDFEYDATLSTRKRRRLEEIP